MNIDEIRAEIPKAFGSDPFSESDWIREHGNPEYPRNSSILSDFKTAARILVDWAYEAGISESGKKLYEKGYEAAAKDPKAWYVLDKIGEPVYIGDRVKHPNWYGASDSEKVIALGENEIHCNGYSAPADMCEKVKPDPWEDLREKLVHIIASRQWGGKTCGEVAQGIIDEARTIAAHELEQGDETSEGFIKATGNDHAEENPWPK